MVNSFFANGNSALIAATRTWYAMGRIRLLPAAFERTSPRYASPVVGIVAQTLLTVLIALPLALGYGPATAFQLLATILTAVMLGIYIVINISSHRLLSAQASGRVQLVPASRPAGRRRRDPHPRAGRGGRRRVVGAEVRLPAAVPDQRGRPRVGIWFLIGLCLPGYLLRRHPDRVRDMDKVFD